jgi:nitric oxide reductase NorE protein
MPDGERAAAPPACAPSSRRVDHLPGEPGVWVLIAGDMLVFSLFFVTYISYRNSSPDVFATSQTALSLRWGMINTALLLTSSWLVATAVQAARSGSPRLASRLIGSAMVCGIGFVLVKAIEYHAKFAAGLTITTNDFFMFYFMLTGIHLLHVLVGLCVLFYFRGRLRATRPEGQADMVLLESGATFWHLVDILWIFLFALLYLVK